MTFGERLQELRRKAGLSQDTLAEKLEVSRQAVSKWERDEAMPETEKTVRIAQLFGVSLDYLLLGKEEKKEPEPEPRYQYQQPYTQPRYRSRSFTEQLEAFLCRYGTKVGYIVTAVGAAICLLSIVAYFGWQSLGNSFFGSFMDAGPMDGIYIEGDLPAGAENAIMEELMGSGSFWSGATGQISGMMNSALKAQASLFLAGLLPGTVLMALGLFLALKSKKLAAEAAR